MLKNGCAVKVKVNDLWRKGTLINKINQDTILVGVGEPYYFNYEERTFESHEVKELRQLSDEEAVTIHQRELHEAKALLDNALHHLLPGETVEIKDGSIYWNQCLTLDPVVYERESLTCFIETAGWQLNLWKHHPATYHHPEEIEDAPIGDPAPYGHLVQRFIENIFKINASAYFDAVAEEALAKQMANDEHLF